jgi:hypothetical protein
MKLHNYSLQAENSAKILIKILKNLATLTIEIGIQTRRTGWRALILNLTLNSRLFYYLII